MQTDRAVPLCLMLVFVMTLPACDQRMQEQPKYQPLESAARFPDNREAQPPPPGTVPRHAPYDQQGAPTYTMDELQRGRERFEIFCSPCHGLTGHGDGPVVQRGFPAPPSYHSSGLRSAPDRHYFDVMTTGYGVMFSYADRVPVDDRWAIVAYIRALQLSQNTAISKYPELRAEIVSNTGTSAGQKELSRPDPGKGGIGTRNSDRE